MTLWTTLFQIPRTMSKDELMPMFTEFGDVFNLLIIKHRITNQLAGCAFLTFHTRAAADRAIAALHDKRVLPGVSHPKYTCDWPEQAQKLSVQSQQPHFVSRPADEKCHASQTCARRVPMQIICGNDPTHVHRVRDRVHFCPIWCHCGTESTKAKIQNFKQGLCVHPV